MPSSVHEVLIDMFRHRPSLAAELLSDGLGVDVPAYRHAHLEPGDFTDLAPTEYRADAVVVLTGLDRDRPALAVIVDVQLQRKEVKRWSWPVYLATLRARLRCPAALLVICVEPTVARWCAVAIELGPGSTVRPLVLGLDRVPVLTDVGRAAREPELAVLSAMAHGGDSGRREVLDALVAALAAVDPDRAGLYCDIVLAALPEAAQRHLEALMATGTYEYQSDFARRYFTQGRLAGEASGEARGEAKAVLSVLDARGIDVPDQARARIAECTDVDQLDVWVRRAVTVGSIEDLFA